MIMKFPSVGAAWMSSRMLLLGILVFCASTVIQDTEGFTTITGTLHHAAGRYSVTPRARSCVEELRASVLDSSSSRNSDAAVQSYLFQQGSSSSSPRSVKPLGKISAALTKIGMMMFITSMCLTLPIALFPPFILHRLGLISKLRQEQLSLRAGQFCARWLLRLIPFCKIDAIPPHINDVDDDDDDDDDSNNDPVMVEASALSEPPEPSIWVCNHSSQLDVFMLLAADKKLRGKQKRPIKIVYWKQLEDNPITKLLFQQCGFIPVQMAANKAGEDNDYDLASFKNLLKQSKKAFDEGFDIGILPEGQLNPNPEDSLLPCFPGAFTLAKMSKRPIQMMALHGTHRLWHARDDIGMTVTGREVRIRVYPKGRRYKSGDEFLATFNAVVGQFATKGVDLHKDELHAWLDGKQWEELKSAEPKQEAK